MSPEHSIAKIALLRAEAIALAGKTGDLVQRASVYHHLYADSGGNHTFPLLAAHGALWASGYFCSGLRFGSLIARSRRLIGDDGDALTCQLTLFAEKFRDINRRVCVETFFIYRLTADRQLMEEAEHIVPPRLLPRWNAAITLAKRVAAFRMSTAGAFSMHSSVGNRLILLVQLLIKRSRS